MDTQVHTWVQFKTNWMLLQTVPQSCRTYMCIPCKRRIKHGHHCISIFRLNMQRYDLTMKSVVFTKGICLHTFACMRMREYTHTHTHTHADTHTHTHMQTHTHTHTRRHKHMHAHKHTIFFLHVLISKFVSSVQYHPNGTSIRAHNAQWTLVHMQNDKKNSTHTKRHHRYFATCSVQGQHAHVVTKRLKDQRWSHIIFILDSQTCKPEPRYRKSLSTSLSTSCGSGGCGGGQGVFSASAVKMCDTVTPFTIQHSHKAGQPVTLFHSVPSPWSLSVAACVPPVWRWGCQGDCGDTVESGERTPCLWSVGLSLLSCLAHPETQ